MGLAPPPCPQPGDGGCASCNRYPHARGLGDLWSRIGECDVKAVLQRRYGPPVQALELSETEVPVPKDDEALVQVRASSVNPADWYLIRGKPFLVRMAGRGILRPKSALTGSDVAGTVTSVGKSVQEFHPGDEVLGICSGAFAEYVTVPSKDLVPKPPNLSFEGAGTVALAGMTALQALRTQGHLQAGQKVVVVGASGGVGTFAVQIAKAMGAHVTAVCSTDKMDTARSLGADRVVDYKREDLFRSGEHYDLALAVNGSRPLRSYRALLSPGGTCVLVGGTIGQFFRYLLYGRIYSKSPKGRLTTFMMSSKNEDLVFLQGLIVAGKVRPVIDRSFPLAQVPAALDYLHEGHARGKIAVTV
jgi:NADPH:quinone reductase-like Zn-dependent oxidoreductase